LKTTTMCWMGIFFEPGEAANAGETLGPRAVVNAVSKASNFLGAAGLIRLNIFLLCPSASGYFHAKGA
jgi:hypothetical protein